MVIFNQLTDFNKGKWTTGVAGSLFNDSFCNFIFHFCLKVAKKYIPLKISWNPDDILEMLYIQKMVSSRSVSLWFANSLHH